MSKTIMQKLVFSFLFLFLFFTVALAEYKVDKKNSSVGFIACCHAFVSDVNGIFKKYKAQVSVGANQKIQSVSAEIQADSVDTDNKRRDKHLRNEDFFDVKKHPTITFESTKFEYSGEQILATGKLTIKAITKEVKFKGQLLSSSKDKIVLEGTTTINKNDFGISFSKVKEEITLKIKITLIK